MSRVSYPPIEVGEFDNERMTFGKHKGSWLVDVGRDDPTYLVWLFLSGKTFAPKVEEAVIAFAKAHPRVAVSAADSIRKWGEVPKNLEKLFDIEVEDSDLVDLPSGSSATKPSASSSELWGAW